MGGISVSLTNKQTNLFSHCGPIKMDGGMKVFLKNRNQNLKRCKIISAVVYKQLYLYLRHGLHFFFCYIVHGCYKTFIYRI